MFTKETNTFPKVWMKLFAMTWKFYLKFIHFLKMEMDALNFNKTKLWLIYHIHNISQVFLLKTEAVRLRWMHVYLLCPVITHPHASMNLLYS